MSLSGGGGSPATLRAHCAMCGKRYPGIDWEPLPDGWRWHEFEGGSVFSKPLICSDECADRAEVRRAQRTVFMETERRRR